MNFCALCGARSTPGLRFCTGCGTPVRTTAAGGVPAAAPPPVPAAWAAPPAAPPAAAAPPIAASWPEDDPFGFEPQEGEQGRRRGPLVLGGLLALALVGGVVYAGLELAADESDPAAGAGSSTVAAPPTQAPGTAGAGAAGSTAPASPAGPEGLLRPVSVTASCQAPPGQDAAGSPVTYEPTFTLDGLGETAWRCPGAAVGQQLVFEFDEPVTLTSVGLVPGYAKTDPVDGSDRFDDNRTVTAVSWRFDDGTVHRQSIPDPRRTMATSALPEPERTGRVILEITGTGNDAAIRDFTTISDVAFSGS